MKSNRHLLVPGIAIAALVASGCDRAQALEDIPEGTEVVVQTEDGRLVRGSLAAVDPETVVIADQTNGARARVSRRSVSSVQAGEEVREAPATRFVTVPSGTRLDITLGTTVASDANRVEDPVEATLASPLVIDGITVAPEGSELTGSVTQAQESGRVRGRAQLGIRFDQLHVGAVAYDVNAPVSFEAPATKGEDAAKIGIGAAAGALIGGITGGGKGAVIGSAVGAGGGTAVVLATDGEELRLGSGEPLQIRLADSFSVAVPADEEAS